MLPLELEREEEVPDEVAYIWAWFQELHAARGSSGFAPSPISYSEIFAWAQLTGREPEPWEIQVLKDIDMVYLGSIVTEE